MRRIICSKKKSKEYLKEEFSQAWNQYRHIEQLRQSRLGFAFTILFALIGYLTSIVGYFKVIDENTKWLLVGLYLLTTLAGIVLLLLFAGITKSRYTRNFYSNTWRRLRGEFHPESIKNLINDIDIFTNKNSIVKSSIFSIQRIESFLLYTCILLIILGQYTGLYFLINIFDKKTFIISFTFVLILSIIFLVYTMVLFINSFNKGDKSINEV